MAFLITLPKTIRMNYVVPGAIVLYALQLLSGTDPVYAGLIFAFIVISFLAINAFGGLVDVTGFAMAMLALKFVIISQVAKVILWQPGDSYLNTPTATAGVLTAGMIGIYGASLLARIVDTPGKLFQPLVDAAMLRTTAVATYLIGVGSILYVRVFGFDLSTGEINVGGLLGIAKQLSVIYPLSIVCSTAYVIVSSNNRRSVGLLSAIAILTDVLHGAVEGGKIYMFEPAVYYTLTCIAFRYRFHFRQVAILAAASVFMIMVLYPLVQYGRSATKSGDQAEKLERTIDFVNYYYLSEGPSSEEMESLFAKPSSYSERFQYYGSTMGALDRFSLIEEADELVSATLDIGTSGWLTITHGFEMLLPRALYPDKPAYNTANYLGHVIGIIGTEDRTTQIAMGIIAESFHAFAWPGAFIIPFVLLTCFALVYKKLCGDMHNNIWAVFLMGLFQHSAVEGTISSFILFTGQMSFILLGMYLLRRFFMKIAPTSQVVASR